MIHGQERLPLPKWLLFLRIAQLVFSVVVLGCSAFGIYYVTYNAYCLSLFTAIATIITTTYILLSTTIWRKAHNFWATLALEIFALIFWLSSFAVLADLLASWVELLSDGGVSSSSSYSYSSGSYYGGGGGYSSDCYLTYGASCYVKRGLEKREVTVYNYRDIIAVTLAFSVVEFLLFITTLVLLSLAISRHRKSATTPHEVAIETGGSVETKRAPPVVAAPPAPAAVTRPDASYTAPEYDTPSYVESSRR